MSNEVMSTVNVFIRSAPFCFTQMCELFVCILIYINKYSKSLYTFYTNCFNLACCTPEYMMRPYTVQCIPIIFPSTCLLYFRFTVLTRWNNYIVNYSDIVNLPCNFLFEEFISNAYNKLLTITIFIIQYRFYITQI